MSDIDLSKETVTHPLNTRDAIHVAIIAVKAAELLRPGQRVGIVRPGVAGLSSTPVGIVNPYLTDVVVKGEMFWLCLIPGTVTGMRHHWEHPDFALQAVDEMAAEEAKTTDKLQAEKWLHAQCEPLGCDFDDLVSESSQLVQGEYMWTEENESARDHWCDIQEEFWKQRAIYTGVDVDEKHRGGFTCSC
jgi:hypothetical protein